MDAKMILQEAGLAGNEAKVYVVLLGIGSALAGEITKASGVNRTNVYDALDKLIEKGLVSFVIKSNRKYFEASTPDRIIKYLSEKEKEILEKKRLVNSILPELELKRKLGREKHEATIYKGKEGMKSIAEDVLKCRSELLAFGAEGHFMEAMSHYGEQWHKRRAALKIPIRIIYSEKVRNQKTKSEFALLQMKFNSKLIDTVATTWVYADNVAIVVYSTEIIATLIRSKDVAESYKKMFDVLWNEYKK